MFRVLMVCVCTALVMVSIGAGYAGEGQGQGQVAQQGSATQGGPASAEAMPRAAMPCGDLPTDLSDARLGLLVRALDPGAVAHGNGWRLSIEGQIVLLVTDSAAGRLRVMVPIRSADNLGTDDFQRMMQANFDTALDGRYAIADGLIWSLFVRPIKGLDKTQLISGLAQVVTLAQSYGVSYASGPLIFGGGDSDLPQRSLLQLLLQRGRDI
ncbi:hypothetical protein ACEWPM_006220 [Roseovarius sp. S4756]|uniref:hypothetical protein n=1 Tax=Roseovarius maritimus TaxID=3342637 RepID=UPI00372CA025